MPAPSKRVPPRWSSSKSSRPKLLNQPHEVMQINARTLETLIDATRSHRGCLAVHLQEREVSDRSQGDGLGAWASEDERRRHILTLQPNLDVGACPWLESLELVDHSPTRAKPRTGPASLSCSDRSFAVAPPSASIRCPLP